LPRQLFKRFFSRERQLLLLSDRPQFSDGGGRVRTLSRGSSGPAVFGRQAPPDDDSPERCCGGRSLSLRGGFCRVFYTVRQLPPISEFRSDDDGDACCCDDGARLSSLFCCSLLTFGLHTSFDAPLAVDGSSKRRSLPFGR
jgi:hypothetical protein